MLRGQPTVQVSNIGGMNTVSRSFGFVAQHRFEASNSHHEHSTANGRRIAETNGSQVTLLVTPQQLRISAT